MWMNWYCLLGSNTTSTSALTTFIHNLKENSCLNSDLGDKELLLFAPDDAECTGPGPVTDEAAEHLTGCTSVVCFTNAPPVQQDKRRVFSRFDGIFSKLENPFESHKNSFYSQYNRECIAVGDQFGKQFEMIAKVLSFTYSEEVQHLANWTCNTL